jgi:GT2 family glycosyltransferase
MFFAHMEEIDLCWRIQCLNLGIYSCPKATVYHMGGATLSNQNPKKTFLNFRNSLIMLHKNLPDNYLKKRILQRKLFDGLAGVFFLFQGKPLHTLEIIKAHREYDKIKSQLVKTKHRPELSKLKGMIKESLVFSYFFKGKKTFSQYL